MAMSAWSFHSWKMPSDAWRPTRLLYTSVKWCWKDIFFMSWEGGLQMIKLWKGTRSLYLEHSTFQPRETLKEAEEVSLVNLMGTECILETHSVVIGSFSKDSRWKKMTGLEFFPSVWLSLGSRCKKTILACLWSQGTSWHRNFRSVLVPRPRVKTTNGKSCGSQVLPACASFARGPLGRRDRLIVGSSAFIIVLYKLEFRTRVPSCIIVWAGELKSVLTLCLKHLDVFSLPHRTIIWVFNWTLLDSFGGEYEMGRILLVVIFPWESCFHCDVLVPPSVKWEKEA